MRIERVGRCQSGFHAELEWYARGLIARSFRQNWGNTAATARELGVSRPLLYRLMNRLGLDDAWREEARRRYAHLKSTIADAEAWQRGLEAVERLQEERAKQGF